MSDASDVELLRKYAHSGSEEAFAKIVARHVNLIYSAALRKTGNGHAAEEITQAVFIILAKKAPALRQETILSGWLYQAARLTAANYVRGEIRRAQREQEAYMQSLSNEAESDFSSIAPLLDDAMGKLGKKHRDAIVLRFFQGKTFEEVGLALGTSENAAKKRVAYALEKLRKFFIKRGVASTTAVIAATIAAHSVQAAPAGVAVSATSAGVHGVALASAAGLASGTLKMMAWLKLRLGLGLTAILLAGVVATVAVANREPTAKGILARVQKKYASLSSYSETMKTVSQTVLPANLGARGGTSSDLSSIKFARPNLYRLENLTRPDLFALWSVGDGYFWMMLSNKFFRTTDTQIGPELIYIAPMSVIPSAFFQKPDNNPLKALAATADLVRERDERIGGVDCYTITGAPRMEQFPLSTMTLWIGKQDLLIHQVRTILPITGSRIPYTNTVTQTRETISVNWPFSNSDFVHQMPPDTQPADKFPFQKP